MYLSLDKRKKTFIVAGEKLRKVLVAESPIGLTAAEAELFEEIKFTHSRNPWFTEENVRKALQGIVYMLDGEMLDSWLGNYDFYEKPKNRSPRTVAVIMAGNIPFVGFHDMMCVLLSGHRFMGKLSSQDRHLPVIFGKLLTEAEPALEDYIVFEENIIKGFDAVIATGSNNSARYFDYYFGKYPHIIRRNRNSLAIITGNETTGDLTGIATDIFSYFGMGCRNVSKVMLPEGYDPVVMLNHFNTWSHLGDHYKYYNNYEYQKAVMLVNQKPHLDTGFSLLIEDSRLSSPLAVLHYSWYKSREELADFIHHHAEQIQCIVATDPESVPAGFTAVKPGHTQLPAPDDYADGVDTLKFLGSL